MIELATPISLLFEDPDSAQAIIDASDCLEGRVKTQHFAKGKQYLFHFDLNILTPWAEEERSRISTTLDAKKELRLISFHMSTNCSQPIVVEGMFRPGGDVFSQQQLFVHAKNNLAWLRGCIGSRSIDIALENNNYYPTEAYRDICEASFINRIVTENNVWLLFDIAHVRITCANASYTYDNYLSQLPMERMAQMHVSKEGYRDSCAMDAHEKPNTDLLTQAIGLARKHSCRYLTIEYYKDQRTLCSILQTCHHLIHAKSEAHP